MSKEITFHIERLDEGFIISELKGKKAIQDLITLEEYLHSRFKNEVQSIFNKLDVKDAIISISIDKNIPKCE
jgi:hypothetical protein